MSTAANHTPSVFGEFSVDFLHPQEFTLPDELLPSGGVGGPIASASAQGTLHSGPGVVSALNVAKCKWSVVSIPPSVSATTIAITTTTPSPTTTSTSTETAAVETSAISEAADKLFIQALTAASAATTNGGGNLGGVGGASRAKDVPFLAGEESLVSSLSTTSGGAHHPYGFLRIGMDPSEPLPTGITLPMLLSSISQLAATYGLDQQHTTATDVSSSSSSPVAAEAFGGLFSRNSILFLAWQRVSQLVTEAELSRRLTCTPPLAGVKAVASTTTPPLGLKRQRDNEDGKVEASTSSSSNGPPLLSTIYQPISETGFESKISHLRAISALMGDRLRNGTHLTSKGIQTCLQVPGLNTTSPFVDTAAASNHHNLTADISSNNGDEGTRSEVEAALSSMLIPAGNNVGTATNPPSPPAPAPGLQQQQPSPFTIKLWNAALGLTSTDSRIMERTLNYGTTTFGHSSSNSADDNPRIVSLSDVALPGASIARMAFRLCVTPRTLSDTNNAIKGEGGGAYIITGIPCGGAAGIRVEGRRWTMSDVININEHDVVHVGGGIAFTIRCNTTTPTL